ncbi:MAG: helix-turn-helix transcriptional regulator [Bacilli bacterium]|nr:helix-turn-helix transcriptional regulator [Bacilli bacterium]
MNKIEIREKEYVARLAFLISFGLTFRYSNASIEKACLSSNIDSDFNNGRCSFLNGTIEERTKLAFSLEKEPTAVVLPSNASYWASEFYFNILLKEGKSLSFAFEYVPIEEALSMFALFHEMDIEQALMRFRDKVAKTPILSLLLRKRKISMAKLSKETGISYPAIVKYCKSRDLSAYSFANIMKIALYLNVDPSLFLAR